MQKIAWLKPGLRFWWHWPLLADSASVVPGSTTRTPGLYPAQWTLVLHPDGSGHFHAEGGNKPSDEDGTILPAKVDRDVTLSSEFTNHVFQTVHDSRILHGKCVKAT